MPLYATIVLSLQFIAFCMILYVLFIIRSTRKQLRLLNTHQIAAHSAIQKSRLDMLELRNRTKLLEETATGGATAIEKVHKAISNTTFGLIDLLSKDEEFKISARQAKQTHDQNTQTFYSSVRKTNRALRSLADVMIATKGEKTIAAQGDKTRKPPKPTPQKD